MADTVDERVLSSLDAISEADSTPAQRHELATLQAQLPPKLGGLAPRCACCGQHCGDVVGCVVPGMLATHAAVVPAAG